MKTVSTDSKQPIYLELSEEFGHSTFAQRSKAERQQRNITRLYEFFTPNDKYGFQKKY